MDFDHSPVASPAGAAVLLHPHPDYGGDRLHPLVDGLHRRLPEAGVASVRFDFAGADPDDARAQILSAVDVAAGEAAAARVVLVGYSFGAGMAATVDDPRVAGWFLVAPPAVMLRSATIGADPRPKQLAVPAHDQFGPLDAVKASTDGWMATELEVVEGADHFLAGAIVGLVSSAVEWAVGVLGTDGGDRPD